MFGYISVIIGYLLGSIPFGLLIGFFSGKDIRKEGSNNIGATNVVRVCGWRLGLPVFFLDVFKGFAPAFFVAPLFAEGNNLIAVFTAVAAIIGHNFPVWLKFKGGKGVATSAGALLALLPSALGIAFAVFLLVVLVTRYISLGSITAGVVLVVMHLALTKEPFTGNNAPLTAMAFLLCALVILRHKTNIGRLLAGTENKIGAKKSVTNSGTDIHEVEPS